MTKGVARSALWSLPRGGVPYIRTEEDSRKSTSRQPFDFSAFKEELLSVWKSAGFPGVITWGEKRNSALKSRLKEEGFRGGWKTVIEKMKSSQFIRDQWKPTIDVFLRPDFWAHVLEGKYDDRKQFKNSNGLTPAKQLEMLIDLRSTHVCYPEFRGYNPNASPIQRQDYEQLKAKIKALKSQIAQNSEPAAA